MLDEIGFTLVVVLAVALLPAIQRAEAAEPSPRYLPQKVERLSCAMTSASTVNATELSVASAASRTSAASPPALTAT